VTTDRPPLHLHPLVLPATSSAPVVAPPAGLDVAAAEFAAAAEAHGRGDAASSVDGFLRTAELLRAALPDEAGTRTACYWNAVLALVDHGDELGVARLVELVADQDPTCAPAVTTLARSLAPLP
jgi:hypothetical protein